MTIPAIPLQTRNEQIRVLSQEGLGKYRWLLAISEKASRYGKETPTLSKIWVPGMMPKPYIPYLPVTHVDPRKNGMLVLCSELLRLESPGLEFAPALASVEWIERIAESKPVYEWPNVPPDDLVCLNCGAITQHELGQLLPVRCEECDAISPYYILG